MRLFLLVTFQIFILSCSKSKNTGGGGSGGPVTYKALAVGSNHSCLLLSDGSVKCWGSNSKGQVGHAFSGIKEVSSLSDVKAIAAGYQHSCALLNSGTVKCWGLNAKGQLGNNSNTDSAWPVDVVGLSSVIAITAGGAHSCALISDGGVKCWGANADGQLGNGTTTDSNTPVSAINLPGVTKISAGYMHTCAITSGGGVNCWGDNYEGQLGTGTKNNYIATPGTISGISSGITDLSAGLNHTCAVTNGGSVLCWGANSLGQLGDGTTTSNSVPTFIMSLSGISSISAGLNHSCAWAANGSGVKCWGYNESGELGNGSTTTSTSPVTVSGLSSINTLNCNGAAHTCVIENPGTSVKCWGTNNAGQLGNNTVTLSSTPMSVTL